MNGAPGVNVPGILLKPPTIGLFPAAELASGLVGDKGADPDARTGIGESERWGAGVYWQPDGGLSQGVSTVCSAADPYFTLDVDGLESVSAFPFITYSTYKCGTYQTNDFEGHATRRLLAFEQFAVERQLWTDSLALGNNHIGSTGSGATAVTVTAAVPYKALARLEWEMGKLYPAPFMIHMTPLVLELILGDGSQLERRGNVWVTAMNNIVVPGYGYLGDGPTGQAVTATQQWIYATSPVRVYRGKVATLFDSKSTTRRDTNDREVYAYRLNLATFDAANTPHLAYPVDIS